MKYQEKARLVEYLKQFITDERWATINNVINRRSRFLTVVLEDIYQPHNASAVLRSCDCFGIQDVHIVENRNDFSPNKGITIGADQWITLHRYNQPNHNNTAHCYQKLREQGYKIVATSPHYEDVDIDELPLDQKTALVFGAEYTGLTDYALEEADGYAKIPMEGFSESFNISVGAAICLYELSTRLRRSEDSPWPLEKAEKVDLQVEWLKTSLRAADQLVEKFVEETGIGQAD